MALAVYMFVWPTIKRLIWTEAPPFPGFSNHLMTTGFWKTFPGPVFTVLTILVCGFGAVYFLGAKGFCTYGCPYGGLFGLVDGFSPGRIRVTDACEQCGHCTAACTSNIRVHEEVKLYGMVVDPGCMKCTDCVSVCPKNALYFGFGTPGVLKPQPAGLPTLRRYDFSMAEEVLLAAIYLVATLSCRGLYEGPPLLMSVGMGGITAYLALKLLHLFRHPTVRIQNLRLKTAGRIGRGGVTFISMTLPWLAFTIHSGWVQWHCAWGRYHLNRTEVSGADVFSGTPISAGEYSAAQREAVAKSYRHFSLADRWGLFGAAGVKRDLAWLHLLQGDDGRAEASIRDAIAIAPSRPALHDLLAKILLKQGRSAEALEVLLQKLQSGKPTASEHLHVCVLLAGEQRFSEAIVHGQKAVELDPGLGPARYTLGQLLGRQGRIDEAIEQLEQARRLMPQDPETHIELGIAYAAAGQIDLAMETFRRAMELDPQNPQSRMLLDRLGRRMGRPSSGTPNSPPRHPNGTG